VWCGEQVPVADAEKLRFGFRAAHGVDESSVGIDALADKVEVFLHFADMQAFWNRRCTCCLIEAFDIFAHVAEGDLFDRLGGELLAALAEYPGIADGMAADHDAGGLG